MPRPHRVRATDVAKEAGVSTATVSYVLNQTPGQKISEATAERVHAAAKRLGYVSNPIAQMLARGRSHFVIIDTSDFVTRESGVLAGAPIAAILEGLGYEAFISWWPDGLEGPQGPEGYSHAERLLRFARATHPEAVVSVSPLADDLQAELRTLGVRSISSLVAELEDLAPAISMSVDTQVEYLLDQGHRHILYAASTEPGLDNLVGLRNARGQKVTADHGAEWTALPRYDGVADLAASIAAARAEHPDASAVAAYNDRDALAVLFALHRLQLEIPAQMAVIGIDDDNFASLTHPALTTVYFDFEFSSADEEKFEEALNSDGAVGLLRDYDRIIRPKVRVRKTA